MKTRHSFIVVRIEPLISAARRCSLPAAIALACFALSPRGQAQCRDGCAPQNNTVLGYSALNPATTTGYNDTALGFHALSQNSTGSNNTATGSYALGTNFEGSNNTAVGYNALVFSVADNNTATGAEALANNTAGVQNTAVGRSALFGSVGINGAGNSTGSYNTATGYQSLYSVTNGSENVANGWEALYSNTSGESNTATGATALNENTTGSFNTATGTNALRYNTTGKNNTAHGGNALVFSNGQNNSAYGFESLQNNVSGNNNTAAGVDALFNNNSGSNNVALGYQAGLNLTTGSNNIMIGAGVLGAGGDANKIRIGKSSHTTTYISGIYGKSVASASGVAVFIDSTGKLGTVKSSARFKEAIKPMDKTSEAILQLEPVTFRYKQELDPDGVTQFGLIAEQAEKISPDLVVRDEDGKVSTVRYEAVNAMLLNEFLKEHRKVTKQQATIAELKSAVMEQQKQIEALTTGLRKVSDQIKRNPTPPQLVAND